MSKLILDKKSPCIGFSVDCLICSKVMKCELYLREIYNCALNLDEDSFSTNEKEKEKEKEV